MFGSDWAQWHGPRATAAEAPPAPPTLPSMADAASAVDAIPGWAAFKATYDEYLARAKSGDIVVEVGVCYGKSVAYLARGAIARGLAITIYAVDPWDEWLDPDYGGTEWPNPEARALSRGGPFGTFCDQMLRHARVELEMIRPLRLRSTQAARIFDDGALAMVMLDGSHAYEDVCEDIRVWRPKVRAGGLLAGDDYEPAFEGVMRAVKDTVGADNYDVLGSTWRMKETSHVR